MLEQETDMTSFTTDIFTPNRQNAIAARSVWKGTLARVAELRRRQSDARALRQLDARDLKDIGLTKHDITAAHGNPLSIDASDALHRTSLQRSGNW